MIARGGRGLTCERFVEIVTDHLEQVLPADERTRFAHHAATCRGCAAYLAQTIDVIRAARRVGAASTLSTTARERLLEAFAEHAPGSVPTASKWTLQ